jgi:hypothetical protein
MLARFIDVLQLASSFLPVADEPIIVATFGIVLVDNVSDTSELGPVNILITPAGNPISAQISPIMYPDSGELAEGLMMIEHPAASAGPTLNPKFNKGKFQAKNAIATPAGSETIK